MAAICGVESARAAEVIPSSGLTDLVTAHLTADTHALMTGRVLALAVITAAIGLSAQSAVAARNDFFYVNIRPVAYAGGLFRITADAPFNLRGCSTYNPRCRPVVQARFELWRNGRLVSSTTTRTIPGSGLLSATLPTLAKCRRPRPLTPPHRIVRRGYEVRLLATAYTGRAALDSQRTFILCRRSS